MLVFKIKQNLKGQDKLKHSMYGNLIFLITFLISFIISYKIILSLLIAFSVLLSASISKELYDKFIKRTFIDWYDIVAAFVPYRIVKRINRNE
jgi:hypothetical protein